MTISRIVPVTWVVGTVPVKERVMILTAVLIPAVIMNTVFVQKDTTQMEKLVYPRRSVDVTYRKLVSFW